jgi:CheY-like chemotaxis protein
MIQPRVYRPSRRVAAVLKELRQEAGRRYDPVIVDAAERVLAGPPGRGLGFGLGQHVLVIHPDEDRGTVLSTRLCSKGYLAEVALSGHAARHHMERARVGVVLLASEPGDMSAASFVSDLRADPRFESVRILVIGADSPGRRVALLEAGSDACLPSAVDFDELLGTLGALLSRSLPDGRDAKSWHVLEGGLADFPLPWLLQGLQYDSHSGSVVIAGPDEQEGLIVLTEGTPRHARLGDRSGDDALRAMLRWSTGRFSVRSDVQTSESTIEAPLMLLLLDEAATQDRANVFGAALEPA